jgi:hypothetical protein
MIAMTLEEEEVDLLVYCMSGGTMDIFIERKDTDTTFWKFFRVSTFSSLLIYHLIPP